VVAVRSFQRSSTLDPVPGAVVALLRRIDLGAGAEARHADQVPGLLRSLSADARVESVTASSAIEGIEVDDARAPGILAGRTARLRNRSEAEFAGYTAALDLLLDDPEGDLGVGLLLHLHRLLFSRSDAPGGSFKANDNLVVDRDHDGSRRVRFEPVSSRETPYFVQELVARTTEALTVGAHHPLLVVAAFGLDLLCIHPFEDGNGRVTRLATSHLLRRAGYGIGRYVSIEQSLYETKDEYYDALARSTDGWFEDGTHSVWPWTTYLLERIGAAYDRFEARIAAGRTAGSKQDRVRDLVLLHAPARFTIADIRRALPGISDQTIRVVLTDLRDEGRIEADGTGRSATWLRR
jgi:Fic family protein